MNSQSNLQHNVLTELVMDVSISSALIGVEIQDGIVTLTGNVNSMTDIIKAERAVLRVAGVRAVVVKLAVNLLAGNSPTSTNSQPQPVTSRIDRKRRSPTSGSEFL